MPLPVGLSQPVSESPGNKPAPTRHYVPKAVRCGACSKVGLVAWDGGFSTKKADILMNGRTIRGDCGYCKRTGVEFIPIPHLSMSDAKELQFLYQIQDTLTNVAERNIPIRPDSLILPWKKVEEINRRTQA